MEISGIQGNLYVFPTLGSGPVAPIPRVPALGDPTTTPLPGDRYESSALRELLPRVTYGPQKSVYG